MLFAASALSGCAGSLATPPASSTQSLSAAAPPAKWPSPGASFTYVGRLEQSTKAGNTTSKLTLDIAQHVRALAATYENRAVIDYRGTETESGSGTKLEARFDLYVAEIPSTIRKGTDVRLVKAVGSDSSGVSSTVVFGPGNGVFDQLPEVPQARWSDTATRTESISDTVTSSSLRDQYHANGSYDESSIPAPGQTASLQSYADGNAVYQWPLENNPRNATITFSPPKAGEIPIVFTEPPITGLFQVATWYPSFPLVLATDSFQDLGLARIPSSCRLPKRFGTKAVELAESSTRLDIVFGEYESAQRAIYVQSPYGLVCLSVRDELQTYYNYVSVTLTSKPLSDVTSNEILGLVQAHVPTGTTSQSTAALPLDVHLALEQAAQRLAAARTIFNSRKQFVKKSR
jgi:hypothetical protein